MRKLNRLAEAIGDICRERVLEEKWLLAPSRRVGFQWLDAVARSGQPVLNVRVKTLRHMVLELASSEMARRGVTFLHGVQAEIMVSRLFEGLRASGGGYTTGLASGPGLTKALAQAIRDLRLAGLRSGDLRVRAFEVPRKGGEVRGLLGAYEKALEGEGLVDYAGLLSMAMERLEADPGLLSGHTLVLVPGDLEEDLCLLEKSFLARIPDGQRRALPVDRPGSVVAEERKDSGLLGWICRPAEAPGPGGDGSARIFRAVGEVNEVREVLRSCVGQGLRFDEVEILHTDAATYVPLIYETASRLAADETGEALPVTFAEGIPARYGRPARALLAWLSWIQEGYPQSILVRMIQDGLLRIEESGEEDASFSRLGALLRTVPIGAGRGRYLTKIEEAVRAAERKREARPLYDEDDEGDGVDPGRPVGRAQGLKTIRRLVAALLSGTPETAARQRDLLKAALAFVDGHARCTRLLDEYVRKKLSDEIRDLAACVEEEDAAGLDIWKWMTDLCQSAPVRGEGPRPGRLHVASVYGGGHSGREHTFIIGLDDSRFPGAGLQDPLLLDGERRRLSDDLPTAAGRLVRATRGFAGLMARLRGEVTLGYCCRSLTDDREMFPSPVVLAAFRILSGNPEGDQDALLRWLPEPVSFAPDRLDRCVDLDEAWLWWLCEGKGVRNPQEVIARSFPHLGRGLVAKQARDGDRFTEYDGHVPEAGPDLDPAKPDGPVLSASALELMGACPMAYFFRYVLGIRPPEEVRVDPRVWLDPTERGQLLHTVFRRFMDRLHEQGLLPDFRRDEKWLMVVLDEELAWWREAKPVPSRAAYEREVLDLRQAARIFLQEEEEHCRQSRPFCFEASVGMPPEGEGTPLDTLEPVGLDLGDGRTIRVRGRIDRVDEIPGSRGSQYALWDYKTGSSWKFRGEKAGRGEAPFYQGRLVQNVLYLRLAEARLKAAVSRRAAAVRFGYFFPTLREHGERVQWEAEELRGGVQVIGLLCEMIASGCFPFTDNAGDAAYSDYKDAFGDVDAGAGASSRKLENRRNKSLGPFRRLRGYDRE